MTEPTTRDLLRQVRGDRTPTQVLREFQRDRVRAYSELSKLIEDRDEEPATELGLLESMQQRIEQLESKVEFLEGEVDDLEERLEKVEMG